MGQDFEAQNKISKHSKLYFGGGIEFLIHDRKLGFKKTMDFGFFCVFWFGDFKILTPTQNGFGPDTLSKKTVRSSRKLLCLALLWQLCPALLKPESPKVLPGAPELEEAKIAPPKPGNRIVCVIERGGK